MTPTRLSRILGVLLSVLGLLVAVSSLTLGARTTLIGVVAIGLVTAAIYAVWHPPVMLVLLIVVEASNFAGVTQLPIVSGLVALGLLSVGASLRDAANRARLNRWTVVGIALLGLYFFTQAIAVLRSQSIADSTTWLTELILDCVFLVVVLLLIQVTNRPWLAAQAFVAPLAVLSLLSLVNQVVFDGAQPFGGFATVTAATAELITTPRYAGPLADSNFWGRHLILGLPLAGALTVRAARSRRRAVAVGWGAAAVALLGGAYLTQSRGTMIASGVVVIVWVLASGPRARRIGLKTLPLAALVLAVPGIGDRLLILASEVFSSGDTYGRDLSVLERAASQEMAWAMFRDWPLFGIGPKAFTELVPSYAGQVSTAVLHPTDAPHNLYAQLAGESGIFGLLGWTAFVGTIIVLLALRTRRISPVLSPAEKSFSAAVLAALIGWSFASIFLHLSYFRTLAVIVALALALSQPRETAVERAVPMRPGRLRRLALSAAVAIASAYTLLAASGTPTHIASSTVTLLPTEQVTGQYSYSLDLRSREVILPTHAALIAANTPNTTVVPDKVRGVLTIRAEGADAESARSGLDIAWASAYANVEKFQLDRIYTISQVTPVHQSIRMNHTPASAVSALILSLVAGALTMYVMRRCSARQDWLVEPAAPKSASPQMTSSRAIESREGLR